ncbi:MAG: tRNA (adenosine(37)-N6)-threonylcarbamoyltransferase complex dimerization subunit type 1 TsaB [Deltaproteobacteria bacterium]|nr:tRNA (adenosine(37)-N6)-threonylcarbamoyltransferase complex dimerization subunit type 1 TsaB [Deltaproteobacteria bacterium]
MILAINTSTLDFSLAFQKEDGSVLGECFMAKSGGHFRNLLPVLDFLVSKSDFEIHDVKCIIIAIGPGSFTGLRSGISFAKGLCQALDVPIIGISSLEALASRIPFSDFPIVPILDSRKGEVFIAKFIREKDNNLVRCMDDNSIKIKAFATICDEPALFIGNDFEIQGPQTKKNLGAMAMLAPAQYWNLKASAVGSLGLKRFNAGDYDDPYNLSPIYLRRPDIRTSAPLVSGLKSSIRNNLS